MSPPSSKPGSDELWAKARDIKLVIFDVDGVLTDGGLYYGPGGEMLKRFDVKDSHGLVMARLTGLPTAVLTARTSEIVETRAREVGMVAVLQGHKDKRAGLKALLAQVGLTADVCAYMGDDVNDLDVMSEVSLAACPADASPEVRQAAVFVSKHDGGRGAARELIELCLKAQDKWSTALRLMSGPADVP